jgi:poly-gamma-glutamate synthesis protein (capsule biosynthesis protein)
MDYGPTGAEETLYHMAVANAANAKGKAIAYAGLGADFEEATRPGCLDIDGMKLGFTATGIITRQRAEHRAGEGKPGQAAYRRRDDFEIVVNRLRELPADYRILSVHYGLEGRVVPDKRQLDDWRGFAARERSIDLIVGHHPHVAQGVERVGNAFIFYGLGNFLHPGTAAMQRFGMCRDYGLMAKVHLAKFGEEWSVGAIEAIPITNTRIRPERFSPQEGARRIFALNYLGHQLGDSAGAEGIAFTLRGDGTGLYCAAGSESLGGKVGALCASWTPAPPIPEQLVPSLAEACADRPFYGAGRKKRRNKTIFGFGQF